MLLVEGSNPPNALYDTPQTSAAHLRTICGMAHWLKIVVTAVPLIRPIGIEQKTKCGGMKNCVLDFPPTTILHTSSSTLSTVSSGHLLHLLLRQVSQLASWWPSSWPNIYIYIHTSTRPPDKRAHSGFTSLPVMWLVLGHICATWALKPK